MLWTSEVSDQQYIPMGRYKLSEYVQQQYEVMTRVLLADLSRHPLCLTSDSAVLQNGESYLTVTAHYITDDWKMRDVVLSVYHMEDSHTGEYVSDLLDLVTEEWECKGRVFGIVTDNGANFVKAARINENVNESFRCTVHTLQLALKDAVAESDDMALLIKETRDIVSKIRSSSTLREALKSEQQKIIDELPDALDQASDSSYIYCLISDVSTRFNSMCLVFERVLKLKGALQILCREKMEIGLTSDQWNRMAEYLTTLALVREVSVTLEASLTPSLGLASAKVWNLLQDLAGAFGKMQIFQCREFCKSVRQHIYNRLAEALSGDIASVTVMLDPRVRSKKIPLFKSEAAKAILRAKYESFDISRFSSMNSDPSPPANSSASSSSSSESVMDIEIDIDEKDDRDNRPLKRQRVQLASALVETVAEQQSLPELDRYLLEPGISLEECPLQWWRLNADKYPILAKMAHIYLSLPASSAPSERVFSVGTLVLNARRRKLLADRVSKLMWMKYNMKLYRQLKSIELFNQL